MQQAADYPPDVLLRCLYGRVSTLLPRVSVLAEVLTQKHVSYRVFHRGVLQVVDKTLGISLSECQCLPKHALLAMAKTALMTLLQHIHIHYAAQWPEGVHLCCSQFNTAASLHAGGDWRGSHRYKHFHFSFCALPE